MILTLLLAWISMSLAAETLTGTAQNAKAGAVIMTDDGRMLYVSGMSGWPKGVDGETIVVTGVVASEDVVPAAVQAPDGTWSQGKKEAGADLIIREASWQLATSKAAADAHAHAIEPAPWTLVYTDGSNNSTRLWMEGEAIAWSFNPVQPKESSSGTYSGGEPGEGQATVNAATAVWTKLRHLEATEGATPDGTRRMGTGWFTVTTPSGKRRFVAERSDALTEFEAALRTACQ
jgi:hypothetical protein